MSKLSDLTEHPKLYKDTYWGNFLSNNDDLNDNSPIFANRNKFAKEYKLKRHTHKCTKKIEKEFSYQNTKCTFDHGEFYVDFEGNYVIVSSPYGCYDDKYMALGWTPYHKLYSPMAYTYVKVITSAKNEKVEKTKAQKRKVSEL